MRLSTEHLRTHFRTHFRTLALIAIAPIVTACALHPAARGASNTTTAATALAGEWKTVSCATCAPAGIELSIRHSVDERGRTGRHAYARVRNTNAHPVAFVVKFVPETIPLHDEALPLEQWKVTVGGSGSADAETVMTLKAGHIVEASVHSVERI